MIKILVQRAARNTYAPVTKNLVSYVKAALKGKLEKAELTIRLVTKAEMTTLNSTYRHKNGPTNVLSFPFDMPADVEMEIPLLGDLVICSEVVAEEAKQQDKSVDAHWAHMVVHGTLHLLGFDHVIEADAIIMETEEIRILETLGFDNPYSENIKVQHGG